jgi:hypothetical protein
MTVKQEEKNKAEEEGKKQRTKGRFRAKRANSAKEPKNEAKS